MLERLWLRIGRRTGWLQRLKYRSLYPRDPALPQEVRVEIVIEGAEKATIVLDQLRAKGEGVAQTLQAIDEVLTRVIETWVRLGDLLDSKAGGEQVEAKADGEAGEV